MADAKPISAPEGATGVLVLANGEIAWGRGFGAEGEAVGEVCFHTAMTGYQEIMTDPSFAGQIITFTFPHIGNVGANTDDVEAEEPHALGMIVREDVTAPSNFRSVEQLDEWMKRHDRIGLSGIDTRALTRRIRTGGAPNGVISHRADGKFDIPLLLQMARAWPGLEGMDLAISVTTQTHFGWEGGVWRLGFGYGDRCKRAEGVAPMSSRSIMAPSTISTAISSRPAPRSAFFPRPPASTGDGAEARRHLPVEWPRRPGGDRRLCRAGDPGLLETRIPLFGICLGHQLLGLAIGAETTKMFQGHRGANHPVKRLSDGAVEITR